MFNATFVMEQIVGHRTYYENLRQFIDPMPQLQPHWVEVTWVSGKSYWERLPFLPEQVRGPMVMHEQVKQGLRQQADVAVFNTQVPAALGGRLVNRQPYVVCTDITPIQLDMMAGPYGHRVDSNGIVKWYKHWVTTRVMRGAAKLIPWSNWTAQSLINDYGVDPIRVEVLPPGVDLTVWHPADTKQLGPMRILFIGGELERKGGDDLLAAFRSLPAGSAELVLVTRTKLPQEPGVLVYNNMQPNSPELIALSQSCDVFVLPTKAEAFGIAAVEASALGLPVVATAVGGLTDIVVDGETGLVIPAGDVGVLSSHLRLLAENPELRQRLGRGARARAEVRFDARANAARMAELLQEIVTQQRTLGTNENRIDPTTN